MSGSFSLKVLPTAVKLKDRNKKILVEFEDGFKFEYKAEYLRVESPSIAPPGYSGISQKEIVLCCSDIKITSIERIGKYALRITFDGNGHSAIYSWDYLYDLGQQYATKWKRYNQMLEILGFSRKI